MIEVYNSKKTNKEEVKIKAQMTIITNSKLKIFKNHKKEIRLNKYNKKDCINDTINNKSSNNKISSLVTT